MKAQNYQLAFVLLGISTVLVGLVSLVACLVTGEWWPAVVNFGLASPVLPVLAWTSWKDRHELRRAWRVRRRKRELIAGEFRDD